ncbi:MAG: hypothetical protein M4D80_30120 [Myxococcota bacterium]|nr:hypothetical protein [Myxococcota bacterium]
MARTRKRRPKVAESVKQPVMIAVKVPASPTSDTAPARKLLEAIGRPKLKMTKNRTPKRTPKKSPKKSPRKSSSKSPKKTRAKKRR